MGFSISSPGFESLEDRMRSADPVAAYHRAAGEVGQELEGPMMAAFREAGAEDGLIDEVGTYVHHNGISYVGIPGSSRFAATAHEIEYGTPTTPPAAPVRSVAMNRVDDIRHQLTDALDRELGIELGGH